MKNIMNVSFDNDTPEAYVRLGALSADLCRSVMQEIGPPRVDDAELRHDLPWMGATWVTDGHHVDCAVSLLNRTLNIQTLDGVFVKPVVAAILRETGVTFLTRDAESVIFDFTSRPIGLPHSWSDIMPRDVLCRIVGSQNTEEE